jgi:hypothetical protein
MINYVNSIQYSCYYEIRRNTTETICEYFYKSDSNINRILLPVKLTRREPLIESNIYFIHIMNDEGFD